MLEMNEEKMLNQAFNNVKFNQKSLKIYIVQKYIHMRHVDVCHVIYKQIELQRKAPTNMNSINTHKSAHISHQRRQNVW